MVLKPVKAVFKEDEGNEKKLLK
ncbi:unknown protein [Parachlamydia acanthamoebae UV-7]|uniref:Uncharacterized protein n=1 Tax=Parachlamydia acanthamoebae (strain UV7) TaxID=765952 RepID=F8KUU8_PARAV|nr:unknown protein [Parachlamydia acanthamoebae UV-7]